MPSKLNHRLLMSRNFKFPDIQSTPVVSQGTQASPEIACSLIGCPQLRDKVMPSLTCRNVAVSDGPEI